MIPGSPNEWTMFDDPSKVIVLTKMESKPYLKIDSRVLGNDPNGVTLILFRMYETLKRISEGVSENPKEEAKKAIEGISGIA